MVLFWKRLQNSLEKVKNKFQTKLFKFIQLKKNIDLDTLAFLEELLIEMDIGVTATQKIINNIEEKIKKKEIISQELFPLLKLEFLNILANGKTDINLKKGVLNVILVIGVNGVGKTTTIAKLGHRFKQQGNKVLFAACDTFRAAASEQLEIWAKRLDIDIIKSLPMADPGSVAYDALSAAFARNIDILIIDTAGRFHNKKNLLEELKKIKNVIAKKYPEAPQEILLVIDSTTGQNAIEQAIFFEKEMNVTGLVLTKLDGTAKGGTIIAIKQRLNIPIKLISLGEEKEALEDFNPESFIEALFI
ncbi:MAG: signal recognition particle-docking protein FtsY [bacterium]